MNVFRAAWLLLVLLPSASWAEGTECEDDFSECKEGCLIEFGGSIRDEVKKQFEKCQKKCTKVGKRCIERRTETKEHQLDEGSLDTKEEKEAKAERTKVKTVEPTPTPAEDPPQAEKPSPKRDEGLSEDEVPRSNRSNFKTVDPKPDPKNDDPSVKPEVIEMRLSPKKKNEPSGKKSAAPLPAAAAKDPEPTPKAKEPAPAPVAAKPDPEPTPAPAEDPPPPPKKTKKEPSKPREEDHDDLRNY